MSYTREQVEAAVKAKGYVWFEDANNKGFDVNIVGVRNAATGQKVTNLFDDHITVSYKENGEEKFHIWPATTDPGKKGVMEYHNAAGVARLVEGQYRGSHGIGLHQGKYEALKTQQILEAKEKQKQKELQDALMALKAILKEDMEIIDIYLEIEQKETMALLSAMRVIL